MSKSINSASNLSDNENSDESGDVKYEMEELFFLEDEEPIEKEKKRSEKTKKYERYFKLSWEFDKRFASWLIRSPNNLPFCKYCGTELKATGGTQDLKYHMKTRKHIRNTSIGKRQEAKEKEINDDRQVDNNFKESPSKSYAVQYQFQEDKNGVAEHTSKISQKSYEHCKNCGDYISNSNNINNREESLDLNLLKKFVNIEEEKTKIQLEMKLLKESLDDNINITKPLQSFADMLVSDMNKLPDAVQRKLRMSIMHNVDIELSKVETD